MIKFLGDFLPSPNQYVRSLCAAFSCTRFTEIGPSLPVADIIAMGVVAVIGCGAGPFIPYCGGRIDAIHAGPATVPEPQQNLASHIASFKHQGFNETEMIGLMAYGHSLGMFGSSKPGHYSHPSFQVVCRRRTFLQS